MVATARRPQVPAGPFVKQPMLLVFKEKHGERYFYIPDDAALFGACLKVVTERLEQDWYPEPDGVVPKAPDFTREQIATLPESMRAEATAKLRAYDRDVEAFNEELADFAKIKKAVDEKNGRLAWGIIRDRARAEYEGYDLERFETISDED